MNAARRLHRSHGANLRDKLRACLFPGVLMLNLAAVAAIALQTRDPLHVARDTSMLVVLLAALP
jgi:hypothetical protein